jgi:hypothetical protein
MASVGAKPKNTLDTLNTELTKYGRSKGDRKLTRVVAGDLEVIPMVGIKRISYVAPVHSANASDHSAGFADQVRMKGDKGAKKYLVKIWFFDISFSKHSDDIHTEPIRVNRVLWWHEKPSLAKHKVKIHSTDPDFRFRFGKALADNAAKIGNWVRYDGKQDDRGLGLSAKQVKDKEKRGGYHKVKHPTGGTYIRKTPDPNKGGRDFLNPKNTMGYSYPVHTLIQYLLKKGFIGK